MNGEQNENYVSDIQHVRRRETIAMTPVNCLANLNSIHFGQSLIKNKENIEKSKRLVLNTIKDHYRHRIKGSCWLKWTFYSICNYDGTYSRCSRKS